MAKVHGNAKKTKIAIITTSTLVGVGTGVGVGFVPQFNDLIGGHGLAMFSTLFAILIGLIFGLISWLLSSKFIGHKHDKDNREVLSMKTAKAVGLVSERSVSDIEKEKAERTKRLNAEAYTRRQYEKTMKKDK